MKKSLLLFTAILTALLLASPIYAADIRLSSSCTLADAIIAANHDRPEGDCPAGRGADTIILSQDITLRAELPIIASGITIEGNGYTISGDNRYRIFYNDGGALTIKDLTMTKGYVEGDIIRNADGTFKVTTTNSIGGAILNWKGTLSISGSSFSDNLTDEDGGAIYNAEYGTLSISDSTFSDNLADDDGGAIYNSNRPLSIVNSNFSNNSARWGGAIYNWKGGKLSIVNSSFSDNSADIIGGAIGNYGKLSISDSSFSSNSAGLGGGAIDNEIGTVSVSDSTFSHNSADLGGAIDSLGGLSIVNSTFSGNSAELGGAIDGAGELSISNSNFSGNSAKEYGGAIRNVGELSIVSSTFSGNSAERGGAIDDAGELIIVSSTFSGNSAEGNGGTIANGEDGELSMVNSIIAGRGDDACYSDSRIRHNINNFIQDGSCSPDFSGDPMLGALVEPEDGSPAYFPLLVGSPAIDAAYDDLCPETDQIGTARPQGAGCDIGAIEYVSP